LTHAFEVKTPFSYCPVYFLDTAPLGCKHKSLQPRESLVKIWQLSDIFHTLYVSGEQIRRLRKHGEDFGTCCPAGVDPQSKLTLVFNSLT